MPLDLDQTSPEMAQPAEVVGLQSNESDREGAMAKADLYKLASYSQKLFQQLNDEDQLEGWVQAKITKAADYIASVYHYLEYEMKFSEYGKALDDSDVLSESQKVALRSKLMEAKSKIKELKLSQAEKAKDKKVDEGALSGGERSCTECGGTGMVYEEPKSIPDHVKGKVEKYKTMVKATKAAHKRMDANKNGIPDDEEGVEEGFDEKSKEGDSFKTKTGVATKTSTGVKHTNTSYKDDGEAEEKSGKGVKSHAKAQSAAEKKEKAPAQKQSPKSAKTWGMKDSEKFDNRDGAPAKPKKAKEAELDEGKKKGDGNLANNAKPYDKVTRGDVIAGRLGKDAKGGKDKKTENVVGNIVKGAVNLLKKPAKTTAEKNAEKQAADKGKNMPSSGNAADDYDYFTGRDKTLGGETKVKEAAKQTMSRAAKGHEKYGKAGMAALAKAGKEGKSLEPVKAKYNKYDENTKTAASAMWNDIKQTQSYIAEKSAVAKKDKPTKGNKVADEGNEFSGNRDDAIKTGKKEFKVDGKTFPVTESADLTRIKQFLTRLNG